MRFILVSMFLLISACGDADLSKSVKAIDGAPGQDGNSCTIQGNRLVCTDGTSAALPSQTAGNGSSSTEWDLIQNADGSVTIIRPGKPTITVGAKGDKGDPGQSGRDGQDACTPKFWLDEGKCLWMQCGNKTEKLGKL